MAPKTGKQLLIDNKRAQNLGIFMSGLKNEGTRRLIDALNSVNEDETFPAEKLTTIRRCGIELRPRMKHNRIMALSDSALA